MKIASALASILLFAAGCSEYPEHQYSSTYSTPSYTGSTVSAPAYSTTTPTYSSSVSQGSAAASQLMNETDRALVTTVRTTLNQNPNLGPACRNVFVSSRSGTVTLTGSVPTEQDRQFIENAVRNINGVYEVNDQLQVTGQPTGAADSRVYTAQPTAANPMSAGNVFNLHVQGLDEPDRTLAQRILHELRTDTILPSLLPTVNITVSGGRVTLEGNVQNEQQRRVIDSAIQRAAGGSNVSDMLQVR